VSGQPAGGARDIGGAALPRVLLLDDGKLHDVFEVVEVSDNVVRMRSAFLFEVGEQMKVRIERSGGNSEAVARVRAHVPDPDGKITELELSEQSALPATVAG
jgi:hypothetical protein